jgi:hypothetical protein
MQNSAVALVGMILSTMWIKGITTPIAGIIISSV